MLIFAVSLVDVAPVQLGKIEGVSVRIVEMRKLAGFALVGGLGAARFLGSAMMRSVRAKRGCA